MKNDPIGDTLRANLPLPITQPTPMAPFQEKEHVSMRLFTKTPLQTPATQANDQVSKDGIANQVNQHVTAGVQITDRI